MNRFSSISIVQKRVLAIFFASAFIFCLLAGRLLYVQGVKMKIYQTKALSQWTRDVPIKATRGDILDKNGVVLATSTQTYEVYSRNNMIKDKQKTSLSLCNLLGGKREEILAKISKQTSEVLLAKDLSKEQKEAIESAEIEGIYFGVSSKRVYPYGDLLCQTLGYVGADGKGQAGLEKIYDSYLSGTDGKIYTQTDLVGVEREGEQYISPPINGMDITLSIDVEVQKILENALKTSAVLSNPKGISGIVMDPETFEVVAIANYPTFDLNDVPREDMGYLNEISRNSAVVDIYEPGSTFKIITAAINYEEYINGNKNAFSSEHIFSSARTRTIDGTTVKCWDSHLAGKHSNLNLQGALENSCNPIFVDIALSIGKGTFYDYLEMFGLTKPTGIDFVGEASSLIIPESLVKDCDLARIGFGQTVAVSKLQLLCAVSGVVGGGNIYTPRLLLSVSLDGKTIKTTHPILQSTPISGETSEYIKTALQSVVENGSGKKAVVAGEIVGGKTGTAQKYKNGVIANGKYVSSFVGYLGDPAKYTCIVTVDEPTGVYYGSQICAPIVSQIFTQTAYLETARGEK